MLYTPILKSHNHAEAMTFKADSFLGSTG